VTDPTGCPIDAANWSSTAYSPKPTNVRMKASPMTFAVDGQQYVVVAAGPNILCFGS
jgi:hypothetical protein